VTLNVHLVIKDDQS